MGRKGAWGAGHRLESSICTFALGSANGWNRAVEEKGSELVGSPHISRLIELILLVRHNILAYEPIQVHANPPLKQVVHTQKASSFAMRTKAARPTGMVMPVDHLFPKGNSMWKTNYNQMCSWQIWSQREGS